MIDAVQSPRESLCSRKAAQVCTWLVALVLCLGLPRFLVVCSGPHCLGNVEFAHAKGSCCDGHHSDRSIAGSGPRSHGEAPAPGEDSITAQGCGCSDVPLAFEQGPLPSRFAGNLGNPETVTCVSAHTAIHAASEVRSVHVPPATGPPRTDSRTALLATTVLLI